MTLPRALFALVRIVWWNWLASRWSGGGPRHHSYVHARWHAWCAKAMLRAYLYGGRDAG